MKVCKICLAALVFMMAHTIQAQEIVVTPSAHKTKAQIQIEQMLSGKSDGVISANKKRGPAMVIAESDSRFKTLDELPESFRKYLDPKYKRNQQAIVIDTDKAAKDPVVARRNQQLLTYISGKKQ